MFTWFLGNGGEKATWEMGRERTSLDEDLHVGGVVGLCVLESSCIVKVL